MTTCLQTDGNSFVLASSSPVFRLDDFTVEAWVKPSAAGVIMSNKSTDGGNEWVENAGFIFSAGSNGALHIAVDNGYAFYAVDSNAEMLFDGNWHHVATARTDYALHLYFDGQEVETVTNNSGTADSMDLEQTDPVAISAQPEGVSYMTGQFAEARSWTKFQTVQDIQDNMYKRLTGTETGLVALWPFSDGTVNEKTGNYPVTTQGNCSFPEANCPIDDPPTE
jgi:hypothetical protein